MSKRTRWDMPGDIWDRLSAENLTKQYDARPPYQRNDYIGWINQAKRDETRQKRIHQMVEELKAGDVYMKMPWGTKAKQSKARKPASLEQYIDVSGELFADIIVALDACLRSINNNYLAKAAWGGWAYKDGDNYSCMIVRYKDHIKLMIWRGVDLDDPKEQLQGSGINTRHLRFQTVADVSCADLKSFLNQQQQLFDGGMSWED